MAEGGFELHVMGMWVSFILSACLIVGLLGLMADNIRRRDKLISRARGLYLSWKTEEKGYVFQRFAGNAGSQFDE